MDSILGDRPSTEPPVVIDSLETEKEAADLDFSDLEACEKEERGIETDDTISLSSVSSISKPASIETYKKKRKRPKQDGAVSELLEQMITIQSKSEQRMIDLEEKRMKMEERQMEKEAEQRREEREFQMQMMKMMMMGPNSFQFPSANTHNHYNPTSMDQSSSYNYGPFKPFQDQN